MPFRSRPAYAAAALPIPSGERPPVIATPAVRNIPLELGIRSVRAMVRAPTQAIGLVLVAKPRDPLAENSDGDPFGAALRAAGFATIEVEGSALRLEAWSDWLGLLARRAARVREARGRPIGVFASGMNAVPVLAAAACARPSVGSVVVVGPRGCEGLTRPTVRIPTLMVLGSDDATGIAKVRWAMGGVHAARRMVVVPGASAALVESAAVAVAADLAARWFLESLAGCEEEMTGTRLSPAYPRRRPD